MTIALAMIGVSAQGAAAAEEPADKPVVSTPEAQLVEDVEVQRSDDDALAISADYRAGDAVFTLTGPPDTAYDVAFTGQGDVEPGQPGRSRRSRCRWCGGSTSCRLSS